MGLRGPSQLEILKDFLLEILVHNFSSGVSPGAWHEAHSGTGGLLWVGSKGGEDGWVEIYRASSLCASHVSIAYVTAFSQVSWGLQSMKILQITAGMS